MPQSASAQMFDRFVAVAIDAAAPALRQALATGVDSLSRAAAGTADRVERDRLAQAAEALRRNAQSVGDAFPALLRDEMQSGGGAGGTARPLSFDALELMAEDQVDDTVEIVRAQQEVMTAVEHDLVQLNALASAAQGEEGVTARSNPVRPEVWIAAVHQALGKPGSTPAVRALWMQHVSRPLAQALAEYYRMLSAWMLQQGVTPAAYRITPGKHGTRRRPAPGEAPVLTLRDLKRLLANASRGEGDTVGMTRPAGQTVNGMTMPAAMEALQGMQRMDDVVRRMQERWRQGSWQAEPRAGGEAPGGSDSFTPAQTLAREVVRLMVANVAADARLLPDVQQAVRELEPALLRLVLHDQRFFSDRKHPARELLDEMTQRSLAWPAADAPGFAEFMAPLTEAVQMLAQMPLEDADPFLFALQTLRQGWAEAEERTRRERAAMARALMKADARNHAAEQIAGELRARADVAAAPAQVRRFLLGPWSQVMAAARLAAGPGTPDPEGCGALLKELVASARPSPQLLDELRAGLVRTGFAEAEAHAALDRLSAAPEGAIEWEAPSAPWLTPQEAGDSRLMQDADFEPTAVSALTPLGSGGEALAELQAGHYVEVLVRGAWARWRLAWASPHGSMLMFVDATGRSEAMTRPMFAKMVELGAARLMAAQSVVDGALDAVAQAALDNSVQG